MKEPDAPVSAIPQKRAYYAIIADYDLNKALCELIDNVIDVGTSLGRPVKVSVSLDTTQQAIHVDDDAGGIARDDLEVIVGPGRTRATGREEIIGYFGVGSKRAVVALAQDVKIRTRTPGSPSTYLVEFDDTWIQDSENWELPSFRVDSIPEGTTFIDLYRLRTQLTDTSVADFLRHAGQTYASFLKSGELNLVVNGTVAQPVEFADWAYPPDFSPRDYHVTLPATDGGAVVVRVRAGLMRQASVVGGWGLYFFCNRRFIVGPVQDSTVGFAPGQLGRAHPELALFRGEIWLSGPSGAMPWNSSKSDINRGHRVFLALRDWWVQTLSDWTSLSRRLVGDWNVRVSPFTSGAIEPVELGSLPATGKSYLPDLPASRPRASRELRAVNATVTSSKPWVTGLIEAVEIVDIVRRRSLETRGRIALVLLDSTLEIAFKEFLANEVTTEVYGDERLSSLFSGSRDQLERELRKHLQFEPDVWRKIRYFYRLRCDLTHRRASVDVTERSIDDYREIVRQVLTRLFGVRYPE